MVQNKILTLLGFCRKAGKLVIGTEKVTELIKKGETCVVVVGEDISPKTEKELKYFGDLGHATVIRIPFDRETLSKATATSAGVFATTDKGFCKAILQGGNNL